MIPNNIFQCHKSMKYVYQNPILLKSINTWRYHSKIFNYYFYSDSMCNDYIKKNMDSRVYEAYQKCPIPVMKADLWRYCIIYKEGGIYADSDTECLVNPFVFLNTNKELVFSLEGNYGLPHLFCQWFFAAPKHSPILKHIIDNVVQKILTTNFNTILDEHFIHKITGPTIFTQSIESYFLKNNIPTFKNKNMYLLKPNIKTFIYNPDLFHTKLVKHIATGHLPNGWRNQKDNFLKTNLEKNVVKLNKRPPQSVSNKQN